MRTGLAAIAALLLVPSAAMAVDYPSPKDPGKLPPRPNGQEATLHVCKKPRCFHTIQEAVNASRRRRHDQGRERHLQGGRPGQEQGPPRPPHHRQHEEAGQGRPERQEPEGRQGAERVLRERRQRRHDQRLQGQELQGERVLPDERHGLPAEEPDRASTPARTACTRSTRRAARWPKSEAFEMSDSGFYVGQTPHAVEAEAHLPQEPEVAHERARLQRHEHALRDDPGLAVLEQRRRDRAERARLGEVRAAGVQRDPEQRGVLEQLQLLPRCSVPRNSATRRRPAASRSRSASESCCSAAATRSSRATRSTATTSRASR